MRAVPAVFALAAALAAAAPAPARAASLKVFAASSLTEAFEDVRKAYEAAAPGQTVELSFAGSQVLRTQIEHGAPADVFASADRDHTEALARAGLLAPPVVFGHNRLVVIVPATGERDRTRVRSLADLARPGRKIIVAGSVVPVGRYTAQVLRSLASDSDLGRDFAARVRANVVSEETNVRAVAGKVALGQADAGFVYATDAAGTSGVRTIDIPEPHNVRAEYSVGVVTGARSPAQARAFIDFLLGPAGQAALAQRGFLPR
jgi:molybdate transport system substrate-binding protein